MDKVLHVLPMNKMSGAERMALLICKNLKKYEPIVVCGGDNLSKVFSESGIKNYSLSFSNKTIIKTVNGLKKIIEENDIKIIHAHDNTASVTSYLTKKIFGLDIKIVSHIHNCYPFLKGNGINKKIDKFIRNKYDFNITCGKVVSDFYKKNTDYFNENNVLSISNAIDIDYVTKVNKKDVEEVVKKFSIPTDKKVLGFVGRLDEQKGIIPFIKEVSKYKSEFNDSIFLLVGDGSQQEEVRALLRDLNLEELFILTGFQKEVNTFYPIIDIFFLPSLYEGLPMVLLEAMAFKKAVVSMNVGSISEVINNDTGILIESEDYSRFVNELIKIKNNESLYKRLGESAFNHIKENYNIKNYRNKLENIYDSF